VESIQNSELSNGKPHLGTLRACG